MELSVRAGMDPRMLDASDLFDIQCRGFTVINQYPCTAALQSLSQIFLFDPSNYDGVVHFKLRGSDAIALITPDEFVLPAVNGTPDDPIQRNTRADSIQIPQTLNLNYFDVDGGLATSLQISQRIGDPRAVGSQDLQTAVILTADEAKRVVKINHNVMVEDMKAQLNFGLSDKWLKLTVADCVFVAYESKVYRCRITQVDLNDGQQKYQLLQDRQSAVVSNIQGFPAYTPTPPPSVVVGQTTIQPLDIHIISDRDDSFGCYLGFGIATSNWQGALVEVSLDGGANYFESFNVYSSTVMGVIQSPISDHPSAYPDTVNAFTVQLSDIDAELQSASETAMLNGSNLCIIGDEVMQFGNVGETTAAGQWDINYLFRGRKGTDTTAHIAGERFVMLARDPLYFLPAELSYRGRTLTLRATSLNGTASDVTTTSFVFTTQSQVEYPVAYLSARRSGGNAEITWQGIGKLGAGPSVAMGIYSAGYRVTLTDGSTTQVFNVTDQFLTTSLSSFVGSVTATVVAMNSLTGAGPATQVIF